MTIIRLNGPLDIIDYWDLLREGFVWLKRNTKFVFNEEKTLQQLLYISGHHGRYYMALAVDGDVLQSFVVAFDATPIFDEERVLQVYALMHCPHLVGTTRKLLNGLEVWAMDQGIDRYSMVSRKFSSPSLRLFSKLGFKKDGMILTKEF